MLIVSVCIHVADVKSCEGESVALRTPLPEAGGLRESSELRGMSVSIV